MSLNDIKCQLWWISPKKTPLDFQFLLVVGITHLSIPRFCGQSFFKFPLNFNGIWISWFRLAKNTNHLGEVDATYNPPQKQGKNPNISPPPPPPPKKKNCCLSISKKKPAHPSQQSNDTIFGSLGKHIWNPWFPAWHRFSQEPNRTDQRFPTVGVEENSESLWTLSTLSRAPRATSMGRFFNGRNKHDSCEKLPQGAWRWVFLLTWCMCIFTMMTYNRYLCIQKLC